MLIFRSFYFCFVMLESNMFILVLLDAGTKRVHISLVLVVSSHAGIKSVHISQRRLRLKGFLLVLKARCFVPQGCLGRVPCPSGASSS